MEETRRETEPQQQPPVLIDLLRSLEAARKCLSLYGVEHTNAAESADAFAAALDEFRQLFERPTCIFTHNEVIVNDRTYAASAESIEVGNRLRVRGVMAVTFVGAAPVEEIPSFLTFLNAEPRDIRSEGGPSVYLRSRDVTRIVATEAVYTVEDEAESDDQPAQAPAHSASDVDRAIAAAIEWLSKQQEEGDESPRLPITQILSDPDMAARLIREAVSKLHASRRGYSDGELATEVVNDLKGLAEGETEEWDNAAPQIRRAISKLPSEMLPAASGFTHAEESDGAKPRRVADIDEVEKLIASAESPEAVGLDSLGSCFGATAEGLLSSWRRELQPNSVILSSGATLETLMVWEQNAAEHGRIAIALAGMVARAMQMADIDSALTFCEDILSEADRDSDQQWRAANALSALRSIDTAVLQALVESALQKEDHRARKIAANLVESIHSLAIAAGHLLGTCDDEVFLAALARGMTSAGAGATAALSAIIREGHGASRTKALRVLLGISPSAAVREVSDSLAGPDAAFARSAIGQLEQARIPQAVDVCLTALGHRDHEVRIAAIHALGELGVDVALESLARIARRHSLRREDPSETVAAIRALARVGGPDAIKALQHIVDRKPLFGRGRYETLKTAAEQAIADAGGIESSSTAGAGRGDSQPPLPAAGEGKGEGGSYGLAR